MAKTPNSPSGPLGPTIVLFSSNVREQYLTDSFKSLSLPRGLVMHYRYRRAWVEPALAEAIESDNMRDRSVLVCFLKQIPQNANEFTPVLCRPLRTGKIVDAYFKGPSAHIHFAVDAYPNRRDLVSVTKAVDDAREGFKPEKRYVFKIASLLKDQFTKDPKEDDDAFAGVVDAFQQTDLEVIGADRATMVPVDPLFFRVEGFYARKHWWNTNSQVQAMQPRPLSAFARSQQKAGYIVDRDLPIELRVQFYQPVFSRLDNAGISLVVKTDKTYFSNPDETKLDVLSGYDEDSFVLLPMRSEKEWLSRVIIRPTITSSGDPAKAVATTTPATSDSASTPAAPSLGVQDPAKAAAEWNRASEELAKAAAAAELASEGFARAAAAAKLASERPTDATAAATLASNNPAAAETARPVFSSFEAWFDARPLFPPVVMLMSAIGANFTTLALSLAALMVSFYLKSNATPPDWLFKVLLALVTLAIMLAITNATVKYRVGK